MLSEALRLIRVFHDMKQSELAVRLNISGPYLSEIERGKKQVPIEVLEKYSEIFHIPTSSILFFSENLGSEFGSTKLATKARGVIAAKVLNFLALIEEKTTVDATE